MREILTPFKGANRLNYICILASELLGIDSLRSIPALLSGFDSVTRTLHPDVAAAINTLRVCGFAPTTHRELRLNVDAYLNHHRNHDSISEEDQDGIEQLYDVEHDFTIVKRWSSVTPEQVTVAIQTLINTVPVRHFTPAELHNPELIASVRSRSDEFRGEIERLGFTPVQAPAYDISRVGSPPGLVSWKEIIEMADQFDATDVIQGRQLLHERAWFYRIHDKQGKGTFPRWFINGYRLGINRLEAPDRAAWRRENNHSVFAGWMHVTPWPAGLLSVSIHRSLQCIYRSTGTIRHSCWTPIWAK